MWPSRRWRVTLVLLAVVFVALRGVHALAEPAGPTAIFTEKVVVVGVTARYQLTDTDRAVLGANLGNVQVGAVSVRPREIGDCAAAGWTTLGAGRRAGVGSLCDPRVQGRQVVDWSERLAAAAAQRGDARLGTLALAFSGCVAAVGPGAALAAARPDGSLSSYDTAAHFLSGGSRLTCPLTLVDGGNDSDAIIAELAHRRDVTLFVTGIGPAPGSDDPGMQVIYRLGTTLPGWLTSQSTRREGLVTLPDLTRTLVDFGRPQSGPVLPTQAAAAAVVDGAPLQVDDAALTLTDIQDQLRAVAVLSSAALTGYLILGVGGAVVVLMTGAAVVLGRLRLTRSLLTFSCVFAAAMMLAGSVSWNESSHPGVLVALVVAAWAVALTGAAVGLSRGLKVPRGVAAAALTVAAFTTDAALGAIMQPGSLLNSRPVAGGRWYGFGNITFAVYATAALVLAGYLADRGRRAGHRLAALVSVAVVGFGTVLCEGWPTMGTDFGGVLSLTPGVLWLLLVLSGVRITWPKLLALAGGGIVAIAAISYLDWRRGPDSRTHLGNFVQRVIDGDAVDIIARKGVTATETVLHVGGAAALVIGIVFWVFIFRRLLPILADDFATIRQVAVAVLATAILGTLLNDGGIYVWLTSTAFFSLAVASLWVDGALAGRHLSRAGSVDR